MEIKGKCEKGGSRENFIHISEKYAVNLKNFKNKLKYEAGSFSKTLGTE